MKPLIVLLILSVLWGSSFLWTKELLPLLEPPTIVFFRSLFGLAALAPFLLLRKKQPSKRQQISPYFLLVVALGAAIPWTILGFALQGIDIGLSGILNATTPMFTVAFSIFLLKIKPQWFQLASLTLGFISVLLLFSTSGQASGSHFSMAHALLMFIITISYALNTIFIKKDFSSIPPLKLGAWTLFVSAFINGIISLTIEPAAFLHLANLKVGISLVILGCLGSGLGYVIYYWLISVGGPLLAMMVTFLTPFVSIALGVAVLKEPMHYGLVIGLFFMILSLLFMNYPVWVAGRPKAKQTT
ncbi:DMT family transporter [Bacillus sp. FJAT-27245]|uniref:DMT family transporter n=1 Tax=Bacillus sp. FJAT-27245 TaxID=1684144 RepID=UPI0006A7648B|nr:DMT family transporter [Bacillus sp. FJAT-27245]